MKKTTQFSNFEKFWLFFQIIIISRRHAHERKTFTNSLKVGLRFFWSWAMFLQKMTLLKNTTSIGGKSGYKLAAPFLDFIHKRLKKCTNIIVIIVL